MNAVVSAAHHVTGHIVGDDPVGTLGFALGCSIGEQIVSFRSKPNEQARPL